MAVNIQISANADAVKGALRDIEAAIAKAGQTGRQFAQLDLSHPELAHMATDIQRLASRFEDLGRVGRGATASAYRSIQNQNGGNFSDPLAWQFGVNRAFTDPNAAQRHMGQIGGFVTAGTRWAAPGVQPPPVGMAQVPGGGGQPSGAAGVIAPAGSPGGGGGGIGALLGGLRGGIGFGLGLAGVSTVKQVVTESLGKAQEEAGATDDLYRRTDQSKTFLDLRDAVMASTKALGVNAIEAERLSVTWAKMTGEIEPEAISKDVRRGVGFARAYGLDPATGVQGMAQASNAGIDPRTFALLVGEAAAKGGRSVDETLPAMIRIAESSARMFIDKLGTNLVQSGGMLAAMNATGIPGFRNGGAEQVMTQLTGSLANPGGGMAGQAFMFSAFARQGIFNPYSQQFAREGGLFNRLPSGMTNYEALQTEMTRQYPGQDEASRMRRANAMENLTGLNMRQALALEKIKPGELNTTVSALSNAGINPENMNPTSIADAVRISNAKPGDLEGIRQGMLKRHGEGALSAEDQTTLAGAGPDSLRNTLLRMAEKYGQDETEGTKTREATAELANAMIKVGRDMLPMLNDLKTGIGTLGGELADLGSVITDVYRAGKGDKQASDNLMFGKSAVRLGGGEAPLTDAASKERAAELMAFFQSKEGGGWTKNQAAGLVANANAESGMRAHGPAGDDGTAIGLYQWHPDRVAAIEAHFGKKIADMDWKEQAAAKNWELSAGGPEAAAGRALRASTSAFGAGYVETTEDERPSWKEWKGGQRGVQAEEIAHPGSIPNLAIQPLEVVHKDGSGNILGMQSLPVTDVNAPTPSGMQPKGAPYKPPPPPTPAMFSQQWWGL